MFLVSEKRLSLLRRQGVGSKIRQYILNFFDHMLKRQHQYFLSVHLHWSTFALGFTFHLLLFGLLGPLEPRAALSISELMLSLQHRCHQDWTDQLAISVDRCTRFEVAVFLARQAASTTFAVVKIRSIFPDLIQQHNNSVVPVLPEAARTLMNDRRGKG